MFFGVNGILFFPVSCYALIGIREKPKQGTFERKPVFPKQRREKIAEIIDTAGHATVEDLARTFSVSVDSIRKDLKVLADAGRVRREYGGAFRVGAPETEAAPRADAATPAQAEPEPDQAAEDEGRRLVAARAYMEINDGDAVFLDISRTNLFLADFIARGDKRVIVTTNMIEIPRRLAGNPHVTALMTGGYLNSQLTGFTGTATISLLEPLLFGKAFVGANGIDVARNAVFSFNMDDGMVKQKVVANASYRFLLAEKHKFKTGGGYRFSSINDFTAVITDENDPAVLRDISSHGIPVLVC